MKTRRQRPKQFDTAVTINLNSDLLDRVYNVAYSYNMDGSAFMRRALQESVDKYDPDGSLSKKEEDNE